MKFPSLKALNPEEALIGAIFALPFAFKIGWLVCLLSPICAYLWASGGAKKEDGGNKTYRRVGCSLLPTLVVFFHSQDGTRVLNLWPLLSFPLAWVILSIGYGIQSTQPPDKGSWLGRFWQDIYFRMEHSGAPISGREKFVNFWTRVTTYILLALAFIPIWIS